jgi:dsDNA-specific endonuclease/ATPase MutS2
MSLRNQAGDINKEQLAANQKMINDEWGKEFDSMSQAVQSLEKHYNITPEEADLIESNPQTLILLGRIAKDLDEKGQVGNVFSQTKIGLADELSDVKGEITSILAKNGRNVNDPALDSLLKRKDRLMEKIG